jgi:hypothetical protein
LEENMITRSIEPNEGSKLAPAFLCGLPSYTAGEL